VWLLLHWLLIAEPSQRPDAGAVAALLGKTLCYMTPTELLDDMPIAASERVLATAVAAARQLALEAVATRTVGGAARGALIDKLAGAPLPVVREALANSPSADELQRLCANCGIEGRRADGLIVDSREASSTNSTGSKVRAPPLEEASTDTESNREADSSVGANSREADSCGDLISFDSDTKTEHNLPDLIEFTGNPFEESSPF
jgi:hypothetical protein